MPVRSVVHVAERSVEYVAYQLLKHVASVEKKVFHTNTEGGTHVAADRAWILDTYIECLDTVSGRRARK